MRVREEPVRDERVRHGIAVTGNPIKCWNRSGAVRMAISGAGSQDLVAKVGGMNFILTVENGYFNDPTMSDVLDGTFRVFGKVNSRNHK